MFITKFISRFVRNTMNVLQYVRLLKDNGISVYFEDENIETLSMAGEQLLTILSSVAQYKYDSPLKKEKCVIEDGEREPACFIWCMMTGNITVIS